MSGNHCKHQFHFSLMISTRLHTSTLHMRIQPHHGPSGATAIQQLPAGRLALEAPRAAATVSSGVTNLAPWTLPVLAYWINGACMDAARERPETELTVGANSPCGGKACSRLRSPHIHGPRLRHHHLQDVMSSARSWPHFPPTHLFFPSWTFG